LPRCSALAIREATADLIRSIIEMNKQTSQNFNDLTTTVSRQEVDLVSAGRRQSWICGTM
jgi:chorismate mutase